MNSGNTSPIWALASPGLNPFVYEDLLKRSLEEDLSGWGDPSAELLFGPDELARGEFRSRQPGILAGLGPALRVFSLLGSDIDWEILARDGQELSPGQIVARGQGPIRSLLVGERTALNILCHLSGIATRTARIQQALTPLGIRLLDTRKTLPGLRRLQKYAVWVGGGSNHRFSLAQGVMVKDNHRQGVQDGARGLVEQILKIRENLGPMGRIEVEVDSLDQLKEVLPARPDMILLDNMDKETMALAVEIRNQQGEAPQTGQAGRPALEASGNINEENLKERLCPGLDFVSMGSLTMASPPLDLGLDFY